LAEQKYFVTGYAEVPHDLRIRSLHCASRVRNIT
jgi:hypothetical protein